MWPSLPQVIWLGCSAQSLSLRGNDILALYIKFAKDVCTYEMSGGSCVTPYRIDKGMSSSGNYMTGAKKKKNWSLRLSSISAREVWLTHNACAQNTLEQRRRLKGRGKVSCLKFFPSCPKMWIFISSLSFLSPPYQEKSLLSPKCISYLLLPNTPVQSIGSLKY